MPRVSLFSCGFHNFWIKIWLITQWWKVDLEDFAVSSLAAVTIVRFYPKEQMNHTILSNFLEWLVFLQSTLKVISTEVSERLERLLTKWLQNMLETAISCFLCTKLCVINKPLPAGTNAYTQHSRFFWLKHFFLMLSKAFVLNSVNQGRGFLDTQQMLFTKTAVWTKQVFGSFFLLDEEFAQTNAVFPWGFLKLILHR